MTLPGGGGKPGGNSLNKNSVRAKSALKYVVCGGFSDKQKAFIERSFANVEYRADKHSLPNTVNGHALLAGMRQLFEVEALLKIAECTRDIDNVGIVDVGGNARRAGSRCKTQGMRYWSCNPIMDTSDRYRSHTAQQYADNINSCQHPIQTCECLSGFNPSAFLMVDSVYYLEPADIGRLFDQSSQALAGKPDLTPVLAVFHSFPQAGDFSVPDAEFGEGVATVTQDGHVTMSVKGCYKTYKHPNVRPHKPLFYQEGVRAVRLDFNLLTSLGTYNLCMITRTKLTFLQSLYLKDTYRDDFYELDDLTRELVSANVTDPALAQTRISRLTTNKGFPAASLPQCVDATMEKINRMHNRETVHKSYWTVPLWQAFRNSLYSRAPKPIEEPEAVCCAKTQPFTIDRGRDTLAIRVPAEEELLVGRWVKEGRYPDVKPKVAHAKVVGLCWMDAPRFQTCWENMKSALSLRVAQGVERSIDLPPSFPVFEDFWELDFTQGDFPSFDTFITEIYGCRDVPEKVNKMMEAFREANEKIKTDPKAYVREAFKSCLNIQAFLKDEYYPGKFLSAKPRLVMACNTRTEIVFVAYLSAIIANKLKQKQKDWRAAGTDHIIYTAGYTPQELGEWYGRWSGEFPYALSDDFATYEATTHSDLLDLEFAWYWRQCLYNAKVDGPTATRLRCMLADFDRQKRPRIQFQHVFGWTYEREGGRCSGVPNTSIGNSYINAHLHIAALRLFGFERGRDYVMCVCGDDNMILCSQAVYRKAPGLAKAMRKWGVRPTITPFKPSEAEMVEFCSGRFVQYHDKYEFVPKIGRLLAKGINVPLDADAEKYVTPIMTCYYKYSPSSLLRYYGWRWLSMQKNGNDLPEPYIIPGHLIPYGLTAEQFKQALGKPKDPTYHNGAERNVIWKMHKNQYLEEILRVDTGLDMGDPVNIVMKVRPFMDATGRNHKLVDEGMTRRLKELQGGAPVIIRWGDELTDDAWA